MRCFRKKAEAGDAKSDYKMEDAYNRQQSET